ncbi:helix-turn-helix transcriptional regulator [Thalassotalea sp. PLHSN55]|uniref:helix-turn-helix transcriptional regulator n=1 Tax=Thalassotalea sp. PLHSN55 TaxID=3435888 RepID=UPI003F84F900
MSPDFIELDILIGTILPFTAAHIFVLVLTYFTLVRHRIGKPYFYFAIFIACFILFLCGPLVRVTTPRYFFYWFTAFKNILLFTVAFPALLTGLFILAKKPLSKMRTCAVYSLASIWAVYYLATRFIANKHNANISVFPPSEFFTLTGTFIGSVSFLIFVVILPCCYLLNTNPDRTTKLTIYGVLLLCFSLLLGHMFNFWVLMNLGCALCALIWGRLVYTDIKKNTRQLAAYHKHEQALAKAQYVSGDNNTFGEFYQPNNNIAFPVREREALIEVVRTTSTGLVTVKVDELYVNLHAFTQHQQNELILHTREVLFMLVDVAILAGANASELTQRLAKKGTEIDACIAPQALQALLNQECYFLCEAIRNSAQPNADEELADTIKAYILAHYFNDISIAEIAHAVSASQSHIMRVFKRVHSQTIKQYLAEVRIEKAKLLLLSKTVTESAFESGFNDSNYFATVFKKKVGVTPKQYQQQASENTNVKTN